MVRVSNLNVIRHFGARPETSLRKPVKPKKDNEFVIGETEIGGEEEV